MFSKMLIALVLMLCFIAKLSAMPTRYIPRLDQSVSFLGLGTVELGRNWGIDKNERVPPSEEKAQKILEAALKHEFMVIDSASSYGSSEIRIGKYAPRQKTTYLLITKPGEHNLLAKDERCQRAAEDGIYCAKPAAAFDFSRKAIRQDIEQSLKNLHVDQIDVALLHLQNETALEVLKKGEALAILKEMQNAGKVKYIGISVNGPAAYYAVTHTDIDILEVEYNLLNQSNEAAIKLAHDKGMGVIVRGGLGTGLLTAQVVQHLHDPALPFRTQILALLKLVNNDYNKLTALALAFLKANPAISTVILGITDDKYFQKDLKLLNQFNNKTLLTKAEKILAKFEPPSQFTEIMGEYYE